ncbi:MAG: hypothetical protein D6781_11080 [Verrucomicrobia bacterium]|nr:MAG: hypothetical protein D6781_11080 [Verrucomicrobiota bacterium]
MEHAPENTAAATRRFADRFAALTGGATSVPFARFMEIALYDPEVGYYTARRQRVGRAEGTDFYTAASIGPVFGRLVAGAAAELLGGAAGEFTFVEIGAEPGVSVLDGVAHPFAAVRTLRCADALELSGPAVVFSNELFDARPFHRVHWLDGRWREIGVRLAEDGSLAYEDLPTPSPAVAAVLDRLPAAPAAGYTIDLPFEAADLMRRIASEPWHGLLLAFDYGRPWEYLAHDAPRGTARAYHRHRQSNDLLANPGEQDLTCHVCWEWLEVPLRDNGFERIRRESQEAFFLRRAPAVVQAIIQASPDPLSRERTQLKELLHPGLFGQKFEVLTAWRPPPPGAHP